MAVKMKCNELQLLGNQYCNKIALNVPTQFLSCNLGIFLRQICGKIEYREEGINLDKCIFF